MRSTLVSRFSGWLCIIGAVAIGMPMGYRRLLGDLAMIAIEPIWPVRRHPLPSIVAATALSDAERIDRVSRNRRYRWTTPRLVLSRRLARVASTGHRSFSLRVPWQASRRSGAIRGSIGKASLYRRLLVVLQWTGILGHHPLLTPGLESSRSFLRRSLDGISLATFAVDSLRIYCSSITLRRSAL